jgi:hypothetical protein
MSRSRAAFTSCTTRPSEAFCAAAWVKARLASTIAARWRIAASATAGSRALARFFWSSKAFAVRGGSSLADERAVDDRLDQVALQLVRRDRRLELERHRVEAREPALELPHLLLELHRHQRLHALAMLGVRALLRIVETDGERALFSLSLGRGPGRG